VLIAIKNVSSFLYSLLAKKNNANNKIINNKEKNTVIPSIKRLNTLLFKCLISNKSIPNNNGYSTIIDV